MSRKPNEALKPELSHPQAAESDALSQFEPDDVNVGLLGLVGLFIAVVLLLIVVLVQAWFYDWKGDLAAARTTSAAASQTTLSQTLVEQQSQINSYRWINRETGVRAIPIERAMDVVTKELADEQER